MAEENVAASPPSRRVVWFARIMGWLCWLGIAGTLVIGLMGVFDAFPPSWNVHEETESSLIASTFEAAGDPSAAANFRHDLLFRLVGLVSIAIFVWALFSALRIFGGIGRGEYFARRTILGLRNFALAVLLHLTLAPILMLLARLAYASRFEHGEFGIAFGMNGGVMLTLVFAAVVALLSTVMAHAAKIDEENRQFV